MSARPRTVLFGAASALLLLLFLPLQCAAWQTTGNRPYGYSLKVLKEASFGYGGELFGIQPQLQVLFDEEVVNSTFHGYVYAELEQTPTGLEELRYGNATAGPTHGQAAVTGGLATFSGLYVNEAGQYVIKYILMTNAGEGLAWLLSDTVTVKIGRPYRLGLKQYPGSATAGELFFPQPLVAVLDRGGNTVSWFSSGRIYARALKLTSNSTASVLRPINGTSIAVNRGEGTFLSLYIDDEGPAFKLQFVSSLDLPGGNYIESIPFAVITGTFAQIVLMQPISFIPVVSGQAFTIQPEIQVQDKGGNIVKSDSSSKILVQVVNNAGGGRLLPEDKTFMPVIGGVTNFTLLSIDRTGQQYRLGFFLYSYEWKTETYLPTGIKVLSEFFDVGVGPPARLSVDDGFYRSERWAGGQPFVVPPVVNLLDGGDNVVDYDSDSVVSVNMTASPGFLRTLVVSTAHDPTVNVTAVQSSHADGSYGVGEVLDLVLVFSDDVWLDTSRGRPSLHLNLTSIAPRNVSRGLPRYFNRTAWCNDTDGRHDRLTFLYEVQEGDFSADLDYAFDHGRPTIHLGGARLTDLIDRNVSLQLPLPGSPASLSATRDIVVDSTEPMIMTITTKHPAGEYGAGEVLDILVNFSRPVVVTGLPLLPINATMDSTLQRYAAYVGGSGGTTLTFRYTVQDGDNVRRLGVREDRAIVLPTYAAYDYFNRSICTNHTRLAYNASYNASRVASSNHTARWYSHNVTYINCTTIDANASVVISDQILFASSQPKQSANLSLAYLWERITDTKIISLDSTPPHVDPAVGVYSTSPNKNYSAGDRILLHVNFTKPVAVRGIVRLMLRGVYDVMTAELLSGDGSKMLTFQYEVQPFDLTPRLDTLPNDAFVFAEGGYIRRLSTEPTTDALLDFNPAPSDINGTAPFVGLTASGTMLANQSRLSINALPTQVRSIRLDASRTADNTTYGVDDMVYIAVNFSTPVVVRGSPVLVLVVGRQREAVYVGGNLTSTLLFVYTVRYGDASSRLGYRYAPNALCVESGCGGGGDGRAYIRQYSSNPTYSANLRLPLRALSGTARRSGMPFCNVSIDTTKDTRETAVVSVNTSTLPGTYGVGELIEISVTFTDEIKLGIKPPALLTTLGKLANFSTGEDTRTLNFFLEVSSTDPTARLDWDLLPNSDTALLCGAGCNITNFNGRAANLTMAGVVPSIPVNVTVTARQPRVVDVYSTKNASAYDGVYTVGETMDVIVVFDLPVSVVGVPRLYLETGFINRYASYQREPSTSTELVFTYHVQDGDSTINLAWVDRHSLVVATANTGLILRESTKPTQQANVTMPWPRPVARHGAIKVDTQHVPSVHNVSCRNASGTYAPGDVLVFDVVFSKAVAVTGVPVLHLDLTGRYGTAEYFAGTMTHVLSFRYTVRPGDKSARLSYVDHHALERGYDVFGKFGTVRQVSQEPTVNALLYLPFPGEPGSLSYTSDIVVDGDTPYICGLDYKEADGSYGLGSLIHLQVTFTGPVSVEGRPIIYLETGVVARPAVYLNGSGTHTLLFRYQVHIGDRSPSLDYYVPDTRDRSAAASFDLNGGWIRRYSTRPTLDADLHLNPPNAALLGTQLVTMYHGRAAFTGMWIERKGLDYKLRFRSNVTGTGSVFETAAVVDVGASAEFELRHAGYESGDRMGSSVDIEGDYLIAGASGKHRTIEEVQTIRTKGGVTQVTNEVQLIGTQLDSLPEIQTFESSADPYEAVGGTFTITYGDQTSRDIEAGITASALSAYLAADLPDLGTVTVTRSINEYCACDNAYSWTLTFLTYQGDVPSLTIDASGLTGEGAAISDITTLRQASALGGSFALSLGNTSRTTRDIGYDVSDSDLALILGQDLGLPVVGLYSHYTLGSDPAQGRMWYVTLGSISQDYDIPQLEADGAKLTGYHAKVWTHTAVDGQGPLAGTYQLRFRDSDWTDPVGFNASAADVAAALESLPTIGDVTVLRSGLETEGYVWTVTFHRVYVSTDYGYVVDDASGDLPALEVKSALKGAGATIWIGDQSGMQTSASGLFPERTGSYGNFSGAAYIFHRRKGKWWQVAALQALDTGPFDLFGHDVSLHDGVAVVGAPGADDDGPQTFRFYCNASHGSFRISYRGFTSDDIPHNATQAGFLEILNGPASDPRPPSSFPTVKTVGWDSYGRSRICDNNTFVLQLATPVADFFYRETTEMRVNASGLRGVLVVNDSSTMAGWRGGYAPGTRVGAAYVFRKVEGDGDEERWVEEAKLVSSQGAGNDRLGWSVVQDGNYTVASAPGQEEDMGAVVIFKQSGEAGAWQEHQTLTSGAWSRAKGDFFGYQVDLTSEFMVVGAPGVNQTRGAAYVFRLEDDTWIASQQLLLPDGQPGDQFGCSVAVSGNRLAVGACGLTDDAIHTIRTPRQYQPGCGGVFAYTYDPIARMFGSVQKLEASNVKANDRLGLAMRMDNGTLLVSSLVDQSDELRTRHAVQALTLTAAPKKGKQALGGRFKVAWKVEALRGVWQARASRYLVHNSSEEEVRVALEEDLLTGSLTVSRSRMDPRTGGFTWTIVFREVEYSIEALQVVGDELTGINATGWVTVVNDPPRKRRGLVHVFTLVRGRWQEQAYLYPMLKQKQDLFGFDVSIDAASQRAVVGMPNRDTYFSGVNSGAIMIYSLQGLSLAFSQDDYTVSEGSTSGLKLHLRRPAALSDDELTVRVWTVDRNADQGVQAYVQDLFDLDSVPEEQTHTEVVGAGSASARRQFYGSHEGRSLWVDGAFDYRAQADYLPTRADVFLYPGQVSTSYTVNITNDMILETPDEDFVVTAYQPGIFPAPLGGMWRRVVIEDDGDGLVPTSLDPSYWKVGANQSDAHDSFGSAVAVSERAGLMVVGAPFASMGNASNVGAAYLFTRSVGAWKQVHTWRPEEARVDSFFGQSVALGDATGIAGRDDITVMIGAPGASKVHVYVFTNGSWSSEPTVLQVPEAYRPQHRFGAGNAVAVSGDVAVIGAPGLESVYVYERSWNLTLHAVRLSVNHSTYVVHRTSKWRGPLRVRSSTYDYDVVEGVVFLHRQEFGASVGASKRTIAVGSPQGDYPKRGTPYVDLTRTDGEWHSGLAKGQVYVLYKAPLVWALRFKADIMPYQGTWQAVVVHRGVSCSTAPLPFSASAQAVKERLEECPNVDEVDVSRQALAFRPLGVGFRWDVTFVTDQEEGGLDGGMSIEWDGEGVPAASVCDNCTWLSHVWSADESDTFASWEVQPPGEWHEQAVLQASDGAHGDRFGYNLALDGEQLLISAVNSGAEEYTSWDFETGDLRGWTKTGTAFDFQPTFGDNPVHRAPASSPRSLHLAGHGQATGLKGRYFIGTYEKRPGNGFDDYRHPHPAYPAGGFAGDEPVGTLTSQPFLILGPTISFLVGGGCDPSTEYIELLVDGYPVARSTGQCSERMRNESWDSSAYINRVGQVRIVDAGSSLWAHINVDEIRFSWDTRGGRLPSSGERVTYTGTNASPRAGAAYCFWRKESEEDQPCHSDREKCVWEEQTRLSASDRRSQHLFGYSLSLDDDQGVAVIGAINAMSTGLYKEAFGVHPHDRNVTRVPLPLPDVYEAELQMEGTSTAVDSGARAIWTASGLIDEAERGLNDRWNALAGALYVFHRSASVSSGQQQLLAAVQWTPVEHLKIQPPDLFARDSFGCAAALSGQTLVVGAAGQDGFARDAGAAYVFDLRVQRVRFTQTEYTAVEGRDAWVELAVTRDAEFADMPATVVYATSDLSAQGVDKDRYRQCMLQNVKERRACGDYLQSAGQLVFSAGETTKRFVVFVMDDDCKEHYSEYAQVSLSIPGANAVLGEDYVAKIRIDDDDFDGTDCNSRYAGGTVAPL